MCNKNNYARVVIIMRECIHMCVEVGRFRRLCTRTFMRKYTRIVQARVCVYVCMRVYIYMYV